VQTDPYWGLLLGACCDAGSYSGIEFIRRQTSKVFPRAQSEDLSQIIRGLGDTEDALGRASAWMDDDMEGLTHLH
jgi:hypothetical protein